MRRDSFDNNHDYYYNDDNILNCIKLNNHNNRYFRFFNYADISHNNYDNLNDDDNNYYLNNNNYKL